MLDGNSRIVAGVTRKGGNPARKLILPDEPEQWLWLPNALVTGARDETPPVAKLRQSQNLEHLQTFIELYGAQDLAGDGGLPRSLVWKPYDAREKVCERGPFNVYGFRSSEGTRYCNTTGPLARFAKRKDGNDSAAWACLSALENMGLLESVDYLAECDSPDAELLHPLTGDVDAEAVGNAALAIADELPDGFRHEAEQFDYVLPVLRHIGNPAVVGVSRLVYRPRTRRTSAWFAQHREACQGYATRYNALAAGDIEQAARACR